ncbi:UNVERIFIED_CONTAM: nucleic acid-binding protein [Euhalothece sp. KZN 001]
MIIVSDTSPITNLAAIQTLDLLQFLYGSIIIPVAVYNELTQADSKKAVPGATEVQTYSWIQTRPIQNLQKVNEILVVNSNIHLGEAEAIVLALELKADLLLMDERRGRTLAMSYQLKVTGLLGVLLQAKKQGRIVAVKPLLEQLINDAEFRINDQLYEQVLQLAKE